MKKGFTLLELIIVIIIIGVLATLATGQYIRVVEKARSAEGAYILGALRSAQMRYYAEYEAYTATVGNLDVSFTTPKYFATPTTTATATNIAKIVRTGGYTLCIGVNGTIGCTSGVITCAQAGYAVGACQQVITNRFYAKRV